MQCVALTGSTGFIGAHVAERLLQEGLRTTLLVRRKTEATRVFQQRGAEVLLTAFDNQPVLKEALGRVDTLIHCAGATKAFGESGYLSANVELTQALLNALQKDQKVVFISSLAAAGPSSPHFPLEEAMESRPVSHYGRSKLLAEEKVRAWGLRSGNDFVILRPGIVYGPLDQELRPYFKSVKKGIMVLPPHELTVSILHVTDLVDAVMKVAWHPPAGRLYFVANDDACAWEAMGRAIARAVGRRHVLEVKPPELLLRLLAPLADSISRLTRSPSMINGQKLLEMRQRRWVCSNLAISRHLHWKPQIPLLEGIRQTAQWYEANRWI